VKLELQVRGLVLKLSLLMVALAHLLPPTFQGSIFHSLAKDTNLSKDLMLVWENL